MLQFSCFAWQWTRSSSVCSFDRTGYSLGANGADTDSGHPGVFSTDEANVSRVVFTHTPRGPTPAPYNGLGSQGLFILNSSSDSGRIKSGVAAAQTIEDLLSTMVEKDPASAMQRIGAPPEDTLNLVAGAVVQVTQLTPGDSASLSLAHTWVFPKFYWYRDSYQGSDNGVRYSLNYPTPEVAASSLNLTRISRRLRAWQSVFAGLPGGGAASLMGDAFFNYFAHSNSAIWHAKAPGKQIGPQ